MLKLIARIWREAEPFQNARGFLDGRHGLFVAAIAEELCEVLSEANRMIVLPAAIMHDIGYARCTNEELIAVRDIRRGKMTPLGEVAKVNHMKYGAEMAREILRGINYDKKYTEEIARIISRHDLLDECQSLEESIVRDADKVWRYSTFALRDSDGVVGDASLLYRYFLDNLQRPNYFYNPFAVELAKREIIKSMQAQTPYSPKVISLALSSALQNHSNYLKIFFNR